MALTEEFDECIVDMADEFESGEETLFREIRLTVDKGQSPVRID